MSDESLRARIGQLEARVTACEDEREIRELIARYGILGDVCRDAEWVALFAEDGAMDVRLAGLGGMPTLLRERSVGREQLREFVSSPEGHHRPGYYGKSMHAQGLNVVVRVRGDEARANSYSLLLQHDGQRIVVLNAANNEWKFRKVAGQWQIVERRCRSVGDDEYVGNIEATLE
jgi:hypothetical protein